MEIVVKLPGGFSKISGPNILYFLGVFEVPGGFKQLREAWRIHFHPVAPLKTALVPSYDQKTQKVND